MKTPSEIDPEYTMRNHPDALKLRDWHDAAFALVETVEILSYAYDGACVDDDYLREQWERVTAAMREARRCWDAMIGGQNDPK